MATNTTVVQGRVAKPRAAPGPWREAFGRLVRNKLAILRLILVALLLFCGIFGPLIAPWPYQQQDLKAIFAYLRSVPAIVNHVPESEPAPPPPGAPAPAPANTPANK